MFEIITNFPWWAWMLCILLGLIYATVLYVRDRRLVLPSNILRYALFLLRSISVAVIAILLLEPYLRSAYNEEIRPEIVILQDNSSSVGVALESQETYSNGLRQFAQKLDSKYDVSVYTIGDEWSSSDTFSLNEQSTDLSTGLDNVRQLGKYGNIVAGVLLSDGIYNAGENPEYRVKDLSFPLYTVALGDTTPQVDARVTKAVSNKIVFAGDQFVIKADIAASLMDGELLNIKVVSLRGNGSAPLKSSSLKVEGNTFSDEVEFILTAGSPGIQRYQIEVTSSREETNSENNTYEVIVEVLDAQQKILLVSKGPHPDISAIRATVDNNKNYELELYSIEEYPGNLKEYSLVITHGLPGNTAKDQQIINDIKQTAVPVLIITGESVMANKLNELQSLLKINTKNSGGNKVTTSGNKGFNLFEFDEADVAAMASYPPLTAPYGDYNVSGAVQILFFQKVGSVSTNMPLVMYSQPGRQKSAIICGENIWRWRMYNYFQDGNHDIFDKWLDKSIQYLATKDDNKQFRVSTSSNVIQANERLEVFAELYNEAFEPINTPEASCEIIADDGTTYPFTFSKTGTRYNLNAGFLPPGNYTAIGKTTYNQKQFVDSASFSVKEVQLETAVTVANHRLMFKLASETGGSMFYANQLDLLANELLDEESAKPILLERISTRSILNLQWLLYLIILLLAVEWFIRKWSGGY